jgi:hypothetical protein
MQQLLIFNWPNRGHFFAKILHDNWKKPKGGRNAVALYKLQLWPKTKQYDSESLSIIEE